MSGVDNKHQVSIVGYKVIQYKNKKTGAAEEMRLAQCIVRWQDPVKGVQSIVGELMMPKALSDTPAGEYLAEFELAVGQDLRIGSRVTKLHPVGAARPAAAAPVKPS